MRVEVQNNINLNVLIEHLKGDIEAARDKQKARDQTATLAKDEAEARMLAQTEALSRIEAELRRTSERNSTLDADILQLNQALDAARAEHEALHEEAVQAELPGKRE